jgi:antitoxin YefM
MRIVNYTSLRSNLKGYIDSVINDSDTVIINRGRDTGIVLMSSSVMVKRIKEAEKEMHEGKGKVISTEDLWK